MNSKVFEELKKMDKVFQELLLDRYMLGFRKGYNENAKSKMEEKEKMDLNLYFDQEDKIIKAITESEEEVKNMTIKTVLDSLKKEKESK